MWKKVALVVICGFVACAVAQEVSHNLLEGTTWTLSKKAQVSLEADTDIISIENPDGNKEAFAVAGLMLNQSAPQTIRFSVESKSEKAKGEKFGYCIHLDLTMADGSHVWGRTAVCNQGTHDWEKVEGVYSPTQPIKYLNFYVLFRHVTGKAQFRRMTLTQDQ